MRIAIFGGSFDPVHEEHVRLVRAAVEILRADKVFVTPSYHAPHKSDGARAGAEERLALCRIAFRAVPEAEICDLEIRAGGTSYTYLTCRRFREMYPLAERFFLVGADMLEDFFTWREPEEILKDVRLVACGRGVRIPQEMHEKFRARFGCDFIELPFVGEEISSTRLRVALAFGKTPRGLDAEELRYLRAHMIYRFPEQEGALLLEKEERREHSFRVAELACVRARPLGIPEEKALLAAMLHDCGKYVGAESGLLEGFEAPDDVPAPVLHQFVGAYLAEHRFKISDEDILNAIRYHTSGREGMSALEELIYLADLLEAERDFMGVERLRALFARDLDLCMREALKDQLSYLRATGKPVYRLTEAAYLWCLRRENAKK